MYSISSILYHHHNYTQIIQRTLYWASFRRGGKFKAERVLFVILNGMTDKI